MHTLDGSEIVTGKFSGPRAEELYEASLDGAHDEEAGDTSLGGCWYGLFAADAIILQQDSNGFVHTVQYKNEAAARSFWDKLAKVVNSLAESAAMRRQAWH